VASVDTLRFRSALAARTTARLVDAALGLPRRGAIIDPMAESEGRFAWTAAAVRRAPGGFAYDVTESHLHVCRRRTIVGRDPVPTWAWAQLPRTHSTPSQFATLVLDVMRTALHGLEPSLAWRIEACAIERARAGTRWRVWSSTRLKPAARPKGRRGAAHGLDAIGLDADIPEDESLADVVRRIETRARPTSVSAEPLRWRAFPALLRGSHHEGAVLVGLPVESLRGPDHVRGRGDLEWAFSSFVEAGAFLCGANLARRLPGVQPLSPDDLDTLAPNARVAQMYLAGLLAPLTESPPTQRVFDSLCAIAARTYEGREPQGRILLAARDAPGVAMQMEFREPTRLDESKLVRKLVETAKNGFVLLSDGELVHGLVAMDEAALPKGAAFVAQFDGRDAWNLFAPRSRSPMLVVHRGIARSPRGGQAPALTRALRRVFEIGREPMQRFEQVMAALRFAKHGALLVIDPQADEQAHPDGRPGGEPPLTAAIRTPDPIVLTRSLAASLSEIDGAILVDTECRLHAAGVILDGDEADRGEEPEGSRARGARFASAWRYAAKRARQGEPVIIVIVSQDGDVEVVTRAQSLAG
jgi:hypothetical protein